MDDKPKYKGKGKYKKPKLQDSDKSSTTFSRSFGCEKTSTTWTPLQGVSTNCLAAIGGTSFDGKSQCLFPIDGKAFGSMSGWPALSSSNIGGHGVPTKFIVRYSQPVFAEPVDLTNIPSTSTGNYGNGVSKIMAGIPQVVLCEQMDPIDFTIPELVNVSYWKICIKI